MAGDKMYQAMKEIAKSKGIKASPQHDLYKMYAPYFLNVFYCEIVDKKAKKMNMNIHYEAKCSYFDDLKLSIIEPDSTIKITDKIRANSVIQFKSIIEKEIIEFEFDGKDESYTEIAAKTFEHIEEWYMKFFDDVKSNYGDLENYFILNRDKFLMQAAFVYIDQRKYESAEELIQKLPPKLHSSRSICPETETQRIRLIESGAESFGNTFLRDDMDCIRDYISAKKNGLEWTLERARYGLLNEERY